MALARGTWAVLSESKLRSEQESPSLSCRLSLTWPQSMRRSERQVLSTAVAGTAWCFKEMEALLSGRVLG